MTGMEILRAYAAALRERNAIELQIERLRIPCRPSGLTGVTYDKVGRNTNDPTAAAMQALGYAGSYGPDYADALAEEEKKIIRRALIEMGEITD